jgi:hypothetical protein
MRELDPSNSPQLLAIGSEWRGIKEQRATNHSSLRGSLTLMSAVPARAIKIVSRSRPLIVGKGQPEGIPAE